MVNKILSNGTYSEINDYRIPEIPADASSKTYTLKVVNGTFSWVEDGATPVEEPLIAFTADQVIGGIVVDPNATYNGSLIIGTALDDLIMNTLLVIEGDEIKEAGIPIIGLKNNKGDLRCRVYNNLYCIHFDANLTYLSTPYTPGELLYLPQSQATIAYNNEYIDNEEDATSGLFYFNMDTYKLIKITERTTLYFKTEYAQTLVENLEVDQVYTNDFSYLNGTLFGAYINSSNE